MVQSTRRQREGRVADHVRNGPSASAKQRGVRDGDGSWLATASPVPTRTPPRPLSMLHSPHTSRRRARQRWNSSADGGGQVPPHGEDASDPVVRVGQRASHRPARRVLVKLAVAHPIVAHPTAPHPITTNRTSPHHNPPRAAPPHAKQTERPWLRRTRCGNIRAGRSCGSEARTETGGGAQATVCQPHWCGPRRKPCRKGLGWCASREVVGGRPTACARTVVGRRGWSRRNPRASTTK